MGCNEKSVEYSFKSQQVDTKVKQIESKVYNKLSENG